MKDSFEKHMWLEWEHFYLLIMMPQCVRAFVMCQYFYTLCPRMYLEEPVLAGQVLSSFSSPVWFFFSLSSNIPLFCGIFILGVEDHVFAVKKWAFSY